jgi:hypothetical protein
MSKKRQPPQLDDIKSCPFCGHRPEAVEEKDLHLPGFPPKVIIRCRRMRCKLNPHVTAYSLHEAIEFWNERHP